MRRNPFLRVSQDLDRRSSIAASSAETQSAPQPETGGGLAGEADEDGVLTLVSRFGIDKFPWKLS